MGDTCNTHVGVFEKHANIFILFTLGPVIAGGCILPGIIERSIHFVFISPFVFNK